MTTEGTICDACGRDVRAPHPTKVISIDAARISDRGAYFGPISVLLTADTPLCDEHFKQALAMGAAR